MRPSPNRRVPTWPCFIARRRICFRHFDKLAGTFLVLSALALLIGCQGVSTGGNSNQQQTSTLSLASSSLSFGSVTSGTSKTLSATVTNSGPESVTISSISFSTKYFALTATSLPMILTAGQSAPISIAFTPNAVGSFSATVAINSSASDASMNLSVSGDGIADGQLAASPTSYNFGSVTIGGDPSTSEQITNNGGSTVTISGITVTGAGFSVSQFTTPITLSAGQSTTFHINFTPTTTGAQSGTVTISSNSTNPSLTIGVSGTGTADGALTPSPTSIGFGNVTIGGDPSVSEKITNTGGTSVTVSQVAVTGAGFSVSGISTPLTLAAGDSASFNVNFDPTTTGTVSGNVTFTSNGSNPTMSVPISGTGVAATGSLSAAPGTLAIGSVVVGSSGTGSGTLTASGASVVVSGASTNNSAFTVTGLSFPVTIAAGKSVSYTITFTPSATGAASATLTFSSNASPATTTQTLTGTGTAAPTHSVNLSWNASTSTDISGYNIYRAVYSGSCGTFAKVNPLLNTTTLYTDSTVLNGTSYCYAATTVDSSNEESGYSNIVSNIQIPSS